MSIHNERGRTSRRGSRVQPRYPIYVPSKGRHQRNRALTARFLMADNCPFRMVVEEQEAEEYAALVGEGRLLVLPFRDRGLFTARNWIRDHAESQGHERHWQLDDNIRDIRRLYRGARIPADAGVGLRVCEDLTDRYENVGISGLNYQMFVTDETPVPFFTNVHVYSCTLVNHAMPARWRLRYNDDTDLCLQALSSGWATILLNAFMADKLTTMVIGGGNTDDLYQGDGRLEMARSLERAWPNVVKVDRRYGRPQHVVDWKRFRVPLKRREEVPDLPKVNEYGMRLRQLGELGPRMTALLEGWKGRKRELQT